MKTYSAKPKDVSHDWYLIDASEATLGRVSTRIATLLTGKEKPGFTKHIDMGDYVIVINADKIKVSGNKMDTKTYYRHSGFPGGIYSRSLKEQLELDPTKVIHHAVRGMLPNNKLLDQRLQRLKVYAGSEHQHSAQQPKTLTIGKEA